MKKNIIFSTVDEDEIYELNAKSQQRGFNMTPSEMKNFMETQISWIDVAKYYEGIRIGRDPGEDFVREWVKKHGAEFRAWWNENHKENV